MNCPNCNKTLMIASSHPISENEEIKVIQTMVCTNKKCDLYAGKDLSKPKHIVETVKNNW